MSGMEEERDKRRAFLLELKHLAAVNPRIPRNQARYWAAKLGLSYYQMRCIFEGLKCRGLIQFERKRSDFICTFRRIAARGTQ